MKNVVEVWMYNKEDGKLIESVQVRGGNQVKIENGLARLVTQEFRKAFVCRPSTTAPFLFLLWAGAMFSRDLHHTSQPSSLNFASFVGFQAP